MEDTLRWVDGKIVLIDQTVLPEQVVWVTCRDFREVAEAIAKMKVRGAPAIGVAAAMGVALGALGSAAADYEEFMKELAEVIRVLGSTRPTAVNLFWALERMEAVARGCQGLPLEEVKQRLVAEAQRIWAEDIELNRRLGWFGQELIPDGACVLTHCNAGALACAGYGTALGVIRAARERGKKIKVLADETRPFLQGARLTAWELVQEGIPVTVIVDGAAGYFMHRGMVDVVVVGADRIAACGDVANKVGTYSLAVLAKEHGVPFYVAAPTSTVDLRIGSGEEIVIEERAAEEMTHFAGKRVVAEGAGVANPAFDVTPAKYVTAIITEKGVARPPYEASLRELVEG